MDRKLAKQKETDRIDSGIEREKTPFKTCYGINFIGQGANSSKSKTVFKNINRGQHKVYYESRMGVNLPLW